MMNYSHSFWLDIPLIKGVKTIPKEGGIVIIGSGLSGISSAYWLLKEGLDVTIVDYKTEEAATFRNCGHILYGTVESYKALKDLHGNDSAKKLWQLSIDVCHEVRDTVERHKMDVEYKKDGYLVVAIDGQEDKEVKESIQLLNGNGFQSDYIDKKQLNRLGFKNVYGARFEAGSAQAHPTKFRNALLQECLKMGLKYHSDIRVISVEEKNLMACLRIEDSNNGLKELVFDAAIIAGNAYSPLFSDYFRSHKLVEPFAGQIITSAPLKHNFKVRYPHSFDHGYEYSLVTEDNRLMIGGWRNNTNDQDVGNYSLIARDDIDIGLKEFVKNHYEISEDIIWDYSWRGIMAASKTGFPFIGPTNSPVVFALCGYTGHGFSWAHGSAKILKDIIVGNKIPEIVLEKCSPKRI